MTRSSLALLLCLACGCAQPHAYDAPGTYVMDRPSVADTLWVSPDGTWAHVYADGVRVLAARGGWELLGRSTVTFQRFPIRDYDGLLSDTSRTGVWPAPFQRTAFGSIVLHVNEDRGLSYRRISPDLVGSGGHR